MSPKDHHTDEGKHSQRVDPSCELNVKTELFSAPEPVDVQRADFLCPQEMVIQSPS